MKNEKIKKKLKQDSDFKKFISAVIDIATRPQIFKQWRKEKKAWSHKANIPEKVGVGENFKLEHKKRKNGK